MTLCRAARGFFRCREGERRIKAPMVFQMEIAECGAASLAMVLAYYGCHVSLEELRAACGVSRNGSVASLIMRAARGYGLKAAGYKMPAEKLDALPLPAILHWDFNHFVVFEGRIGTRCYIADPAQGPVRMEQGELIRHYTGIALAFQPDEGFRPRGRRRGVLSTLLPLLGRVRGATAAIAWAGLLLVLPGLLVPTMLRVFIDDVMVGKQEWLAPLLLAFGLTAMAQALLVWLEQLAMRRGELLLASQTTVEMLRHLFTLPMSFFAQRHSAVLQQQVAANSAIAGAVFGQLAGNAINVLTAGFFLALMCGYSMFLSGVAVAAAAVNVLLLRFVNERRQTLNQSLMMENTRQLSLTVTGIAMMESLRASGRDDAFFNEWSSSLAAYVMARQAMQRSSALFDMLPSLLYGVSGVIILCFGAWRIIEGDMTLGSMMAFNALLACFMGPVTSLTAAGAELQEVKGAAERVEDVMLHSPEKRFAPEPMHAEEERAAPEPLALELRDICFGYSRFEEPLIRDVSLTLEPGGWTALVGPSGSGKSTVAKLACGLYAPWSGQVLLGGRPMEEHSRSWCNRRIACVDQHILLFSGTVADNVSLYRKAVDPKLLHAALRDARLADELARRGGVSELDIEVGEAGNNFSGGQRQRLEIARALALSAPVLILDEATSALDPGTEHQVYAAVRERGCSCLVIAHRLSAIRDCDEIIVMEDGRAVERGRHDDLMALDGAYRRLMRTM